MSNTVFIYNRGDELPGLTLPWQTETAQNTYTDLDLSAGHTFSLTLTNSAGTAELTKTSGITGNNGSVVIDWAVDELDIAEALYDFELVATETATGKTRTYRRGERVSLRII